MARPERQPGGAGGRAGTVQPTYARQLVPPGHRPAPLRNAKGLNTVSMTVELKGHSITNLTEAKILKECAEAVDAVLQRHGGSMELLSPDREYRVHDYRTGFYTEDGVYTYSGGVHAEGAAIPKPQVSRTEAAED